jgi:hypothetical protein
MANIKLIGSRLTKISAERNPDFDGKLSMGTNIQIKSVEKIKDAKDSVSIDYLFEIDYAELGKVSIGGKLFISGDSKEIKAMQKVVEKKDAKSPEYLMITNLILQKASIKAFELEDELGLPIHIRLPTIDFKKE